MIENFVFGLVLWVAVTLFLLTWAKKFASSQTKPTTSPVIVPDTTVKDQEIAELQQQCQRLQLELEQRKEQNLADFKEITFEELQSLLVNYPSASKMAEAKPDLPARNLVAMFTPLENLLQRWGYQPIGQVWGQVNYDPQIHQADEDDISEGETVYIRFIGYRDGEKILVPAKVSRNLPI